MTSGAHLTLVQMAPAFFSMVEIEILTKVMGTVFAMLYAARLLAERFQTADALLLARRVGSGECGVMTHETSLLLPLLPFVPLLAALFVAFAESGDAGAAPRLPVGHRAVARAWPASCSGGSVPSTAARRSSWSPGAGFSTRTCSPRW